MRGKSINLIFYDNPISRSYLKCFLYNDLSDIEIIYLSKYSSIELVRKYNFVKNNYFPIKFLKNIDIQNFTYQIEDFFGSFIS